MILTQITSATCVEKCDVFVEDTGKIVWAQHQRNTLWHNVEKGGSERYRNTTAQDNQGKLDAKGSNFIKVSVLDSCDNPADVERDDEVRNASQDEPNGSLQKVDPFSFQIWYHF